MREAVMRSRRSPTSGALVLVVGCCAFLLAGSTSARVELSRDAVWITLGADAFATLATSGEFYHGGLPLRPFGESAGVVVTRVERRDLERLADRLHAAHRRCGSFVRHDSAAEALDVLATLERRSSDQARFAFSIDQGPVVAQLQAAVSEPPMLDTISHLSEDFVNRFCEHPPGVAAAQWIHDLWSSYAAGRDDVSVEMYPHPDWPQPSVILTIEGADLPEELVILGGHLDSTVQGSTSDPDFVAPGADDNASGIAVLSEVIRVAMSRGFRPRRTVQFMGYAAEEIGLGGSLEIAGAYNQAGANVVAVLQFDMTDYFGSTEDVFLIDDFVDPALSSFVGQLLDVYQADLTWSTTSCGYPCSDHASWMLNGYDVAFPFEADFYDHNPWIHTDQDTLATLGYSVAHAAKFARLGAAFMVEVAKSAGEVIFADGFESGTTAAWSETVP